MAQQIKKGYIRGVRGMIVTGLKPDGTEDPNAVSYAIKTAQQVSVSTVTESGESSALRGGDRLLAYVKDPDTVVMLTLTVQDARFDARAMEAIAGGTLIEETVGSEAQIVGWEAPNIEEQQNPPYFKLEVYATNYNANSAVDGYIKYTFYYCRAIFGNETLQDRSWTIPEMTIEVLHNPNADTGLYKKEFVDELPANLA